MQRKHQYSQSYPPVIIPQSQSQCVDLFVFVYIYPLIPVFNGVRLQNAYSSLQSSESPEGADLDDYGEGDKNQETAVSPSETVTKKKTKKGFSFFGFRRSKNKKANDDK